MTKGKLGLINNHGFATCCVCVDFCMIMAEKTTLKPTCFIDYLCVLYVRGQVSDQELFKMSLTDLKENGVMLCKCV